MYNGGMEVKMSERYADWDCRECGQMHDPSLKHAEQTIKCPHCRAQDAHCTLCFGTGKVTPSQAEEWKRQNQTPDIQNMPTTNERAKWIVDFGTTYSKGFNAGYLEALKSSQQTVQELSEWQKSCSCRCHACIQLRDFLIEKGRTI